MSEKMRAIAGWLQNKAETMIKQAAERRADAEGMSGGTAKGNARAKHMICTAIWLLECRAADRHGRARPTVIEAVAGKLCPRCGHIGCPDEVKP